MRPIQHLSQAEMACIVATVSQKESDVLMMLQAKGMVIWGVESASETTRRQLEEDVLVHLLLDFATSSPLLRAHRSIGLSRPYCPF